MKVYRGFESHPIRHYFDDTPKAIGTSLFLGEAPQLDRRGVGGFDTSTVYLLSRDWLGEEGKDILWGCRLLMPVVTRLM